MSEFTNNKEKRIERLLKLFYAILEKDAPGKAIKQNQDLIDQSLPSDIITLVDLLVKSKLPIDKLKTGVNKFLNVMYTSIKEYPYTKPADNSFLDCCVKNNAVLDEKLKTLRPLIKQINKSPDDNSLKENFITDLKIILEYENYYLIKENVLFPFLEKQWEEFRCLNIMWSFHDDIRKNIKNLISVLSSDKLNTNIFNRLTGDIFFNIYAIIFREERILFPYIMETISGDGLDSLFDDSKEIGFPFYQPPEKISKKKTIEKVSPSNIDLKSGNLTAEQIILLFNHLPVDITFVDEYDKVKYFSTPKNRIFPRTNAIIGREVNNCHPPESVHVVEQIVDAFKTGTKDKASFWIQMKGEFILIQYFALRDENGNYKGVIEVSQEISEIKSLEGERRLLDWE
ncbi:MAG: PAS domain-containing protein [Bacteroidota bacterium]|nr:PAS domain-containing protein [Bacteroidota bacterium]